ncbi:hypothetical protein NGA_0233700, partial [Nannochloropsis gaditana CCMP526]|uniref:uncharacterized protein n=1 Tax=Nannochloropsis gaditana (strain CCMP526) TaxID=1093141 RepID=UPI00029F78E3
MSVPRFPRPGPLEGVRRSEDFPFVRRPQNARAAGSCKIDFIRPKYHCETEIWPLGFKAARVEMSHVLRQLLVLFF